MARISMLFSLAFALAVASVSGHSSASALVKKGQYSPPCTVEQLKTLPFVQIKKFIDLKSSSVLKTPALSSTFSACKDYTSFLAEFSKRGDFEFAFHGLVSAIWKAKFLAMRQSLLAVQTGFGVGGKASLQLKKNYEGMVNGFAVIPAKIAEISARHQFKARAKLTVQEKKEFAAVFGSFKKCFNSYIDAIAKFSDKKHVSAGGQLGGQIGKHLIGNGNFFPGIGGKAEFSASASGKVNVHGKKKKKKPHH
ncbi:PREDICTED: uncharacterized protein LOC104808337 [Tarenaya hassleriana]|uniref:uncharacterized protein LOC104808337 n=1 Tax=Tarenaya hassleriana TaxID=28532 RepID=UPI00053C11C0|nr:PREDICTED: uncharacterized protein LOC104808337 [Tarenaya hassleriana]